MDADRVVELVDLHAVPQAHARRPRGEEREPAVGRRRGAAEGLSEDDLVHEGGAAPAGSRPEITPSPALMIAPCSAIPNPSPSCASAACTALVTRSARFVVASRAARRVARECRPRSSRAGERRSVGSCRHSAGRSAPMPLKTPIIAAVRAVASLRLSPQGKQSKLSRRSTSIRAAALSTCTVAAHRHAVLGVPGNGSWTLVPPRVRRAASRSHRPSAARCNRTTPRRTPRAGPSRSPSPSSSSRALRSARRPATPGSRPATGPARGCASRTCARCRRGRGSRAAPGRPGRSARPPRRRPGRSPCRSWAGRCRNRPGGPSPAR